MLGKTTFKKTFNYKLTDIHSTCHEPTNYVSRFRLYKSFRSVCIKIKFGRFLSREGKSEWGMEIEFNNRI